MNIYKDLGNLYTLQGMSPYPTLAKGTSSSKIALGSDMLVPSKVIIALSRKCSLQNSCTQIILSQKNTLKKNGRKRLSWKISRQFISLGIQSPSENGNGT